MARKKQDDSGKPKGHKVRIAADLYDQLAAQGDDVDARVDTILRAHLNREAKAGRAAGLVGLIADVAAPALKQSNLLPQMEAIAKDVASRMAREMAQAATAAAAQAWGQQRGNAEEPPQAAAAAKPDHAHPVSTPKTSPAAKQRRATPKKAGSTAPKAGGNGSA